MLPDSRLLDAESLAAELGRYTNPGALRDHYALGSVLGQGSTSTVRLATCREWARKGAKELFSPPFGACPRFASRLPCFAFPSPRCRALPLRFADKCLRRGDREEIRGETYIGAFHSFMLLVYCCVEVDGGGIGSVVVGGVLVLLSLLL